MTDYEILSLMLQIILIVAAVVDVIMKSKK